MNRENRCQHCGGYLVKYRNPNQRYCSEAACQRQRKNLWRRNKLSTDGDYRSNQNAATRKWRQSHHDSWQPYRTTHPAYVIRKRERQRIRDQQSKDLYRAKSDASTPHKLVTSGTYHLIPVTESHLAKSDALIVKIALITDSSVNAVAFGQSCKEITL
ncbi:conserved hypothetical protein [Gammaproteobacteria bacterium]